MDSWLRLACRRPARGAAMPRAFRGIVDFIVLASRSLLKNVGIDGQKGAVGQKIPAFLIIYIELAFAGNRPSQV
jgi:hypothetical protein